MPLRGGRRRARAIGGPCGHRWSRGREGALSGRISCARNVETPSWSAGGERAAGGRPIARGAEYQAGKDGREANAGGRKETGTRGQQAASSRAGTVITGRIPDMCRARKGADASQVSL